MARPPRILLPVLVLLALPALPAAALAQSLELGATGALASDGAPPASDRLSVAISGASVANTSVTLGLAYDGAAQLDFGVQANDTFGPLGNVIGDGDLSIRTDGAVQGGLGVRGVLGPVALGIHVSGFSDDPARFDPLAVAGSARPDFGAAGWGVRLSAAVRPDRVLIVEATPGFYRVQGGSAWRFDGRVRWLRAIGPHELSVRLRGYLAPAHGAADGAVGIGFTYRRRRAPDLDAALYLGDSPSGIEPGATASLGQQLGPVDATLTLSAEPYRLDVPPYRAQLGLTFGLGSGQAKVSGAAVAGPTGAEGVLGLRYALPIELRSP